MNLKKTITLTIVILCGFTLVAKELEHNLTPNEIDFKVKALEDINNKILNSIYWTIGLVGAIFSAIIALNFYQNFTINTRKIDTIKSELNKSTSELKNQLKLDNDKIIKESISSINNTIEKIAQDKFHNLQSKFDKLESDYKDLKRENLIARAEKFKEKGQRGYLISYTEVLKLDIEKNYDWRIFESLEMLNKIVKEGKWNLEDTSKLITIIDNLPTRFETIVNTIKNNIQIE